MTGDHIEAMYGDMKEARLQTLVRQAAIMAGWSFYHTHDSRRSDEGFPDCFMVRETTATRVTHSHAMENCQPGCTLPTTETVTRTTIKVRELKDRKGKVTVAQQKWLDLLGAAGLDVGVWRPADWGTGSILEELE